MSTVYDKEKLPPRTVSINGREWAREEFDKYSFQWRREMSGDEYNWDLAEEDFSLVGAEVPIRVVELQHSSGEWRVSGLETAGPSYHRPGFTELISAEFASSTDDFEEAVGTVVDFLHRLS
jgi:hypothetical protein